MAQAANSANEKLRIIHCFRSPVGGIFRHVRDLIHEQAKLGHDIGVICDNNTGGAYEDAMLEELKPYLALGLLRLPMDRSIGPRDIKVIYSLYKELKNLNVDVLHSHGAKGGAYARLIGSILKVNGKHPARLYCPHGGSIHYDQKKLSGKIFFTLERFLERFTDRLLFVSAYERDGFFSKVGKAHCAHSLIRNGLTEEEFIPVEANEDATDFIYMGMMRDLKGVDLFINALPLVAEKTGRSISATLVGDGPDLERYKQRAEKLPNSVTTTFKNPMPAREGFALGKTLVVPSRAESMPYIVLEALAAQRPLIATHVGGIPEIYGEFSRILVDPDSLDALVATMSGHLNGSIHLPDKKTMAERIKDNFSAKVMADDVMKAYRDTLAH